MGDWHTGPMVAADTETTGIAVETDRVVTAALIRIDGPTVEPLSWLINPGVDIPEAATAVHGITTERARADGKPPADCRDQVAGELALALTRGVPIVGMNVPYDLTLLDLDCRRHGVPTVEDRLDGRPLAPVIDVMVLDKAVDRYRRGGRKLTDLCAHYRVRIDGAHDSSHDALAAARVAWAIATRYPQIAAMDLADLHAAQVSWAAEQADSFRRYLMQKREQLRVQAGRTTDSAARDLAEQDMATIDARIDSVDGAWPIRPYTGAGA